MDSVKQVPKMEFELREDLSQAEREKITTIKQAREETLIKWRELMSISRLFFTRSNNRCGFCFYTQNLTMWFECDRCPVKKRCEKTAKKLAKIGDLMSEVLVDTIQYVEDLEVED